jgi:hypothetical protein
MIDLTVKKSRSDKSTDNSAPCSVHSTSTSDQEPLGLNDKEFCEEHVKTLGDEGERKKTIQEFSINDTDVWFSEDSIECVLGAV